MENHTKNTQAGNETLQMPLKYPSRVKFQEYLQFKEDPIGLTQSTKKSIHRLHKLVKTQNICSIEVALLSFANIDEKKNHLFVLRGNNAQQLVVKQIKKKIKTESVEIITSKIGFTADVLVHLKHNKFLPIKRQKISKKTYMFHYDILGKTFIRIRLLQDNSNEIFLKSTKGGN